MKRILFVDDEPNVLAGLRNLLRKLRDEWDMTFLEGGDKALEALRAGASFDVVVTDMRMPVVDGAMLLQEIRDRHPATVRIVLSGQTEQAVAQRLLSTAHQFLAKPCDAERLKGAIDRSLELRELLGDERLRRIVGEIGQLPTLPTAYHRLVETLADERKGLGDLALVIASDTALSAKVLQVVNSAFFGLAHQVTKIDRAVAFLGVDVIKNLTLAVEVFSRFSGRSFPAGLSLDGLQRHALLTARLAREVARGQAWADDAFAAGLLHEIGTLLLASRLPERLTEVCVEAASSRRARPEVEQELLGATHATIGAYLVGIWGLPYRVVEAVAHHHRAPGPGASFDHTAAVYLASRLAEEAEATGGELPLLDAELVEAWGIKDELGRWRELALSELQKVEQEVSA